MNVYLRRVVVAGLLALAVGFVPMPAHAQEVNLTGTWVSESAGVYYVRQVGDSVWWVALSEDDGKTWTNVFHGKLGKDELTGEWADVPKGGAKASGTLTFTLQMEDGKVIGLTKVRETGTPYHAKMWKRKP